MTVWKEEKIFLFRPYQTFFAFHFGIKLPEIQCNQENLQGDQSLQVYHSKNVSSDLDS
jgi:hypothetical protein